MGTGELLGHLKECWGVTLLHATYEPLWLLFLFTKAFSKSKQTVLHTYFVSWISKMSVLIDKNIFVSFNLTEPARKTEH